MDIYTDKLYEIQLIKYMKTLSPKPVIIDQDIKDITLKSIINYQVVFLDVNCSNCDVKLVDTSGVYSCNKYRYASCGNCGFKTKILY